MLTSHNAVRREAANAPHVCLSCRLKSQSITRTSSLSRRNLSTQTSHPNGALQARHANTPAVKRHRALRSVGEHSRRFRSSARSDTASSLVRRSSQRPYHSSSSLRQEATVANLQDPPIPPPPPELPGKHEHTFLKTGGIRDQLRQWQELHGKDLDAKFKILEQANDADDDGTPNNLTRLPDASESLREQAEREEEEQRSIAYFSRTSELDDGATTHNRFLQPGDLIELEFTKSERESIIAVYVRRSFAGSQIFTMHGRWMFIPERSVQYSIPGWVSPNMVEPLLDYLPDPKNMQELDRLQDKSYVEDLSVPRAVASPLIKKMIQFHSESQEIYRKNASALDSAHDILAHDTDLRYGSLMSAATTLLKTPPAKLPVTALYTVRKSLAHAGFAFNIDPRSHRLTGYLQIRSKEQCRMVETVRQWVREWQDDMAIRYTLDDDGRALRRHKTKKGAEYVYGFIEKAKKIIAKSRETRDPTTCGNIGPSKKKFPITSESDSVRISYEEEFNNQDTELVRFIEAWACSNMYYGLPRIESLPPLLLQATGMYEGNDLNTSTGFMFLQELGTIMPYENRVRFDQHLLLPSSQHSKPLQTLMASLMDMANKHNFQDSMADLRHDWGDTPVLCIDSPSAHEIDDGLSVESAGDDSWWVHIHIANPTAFFSRDHPLAKMARHMGESIYMPERTYMMLPRWATNRHFSLGRNRPCLTFSARMDTEGKTLEHKIQPGFIRNVIRLSPSDVTAILGGEESQDQVEAKEVVVGGEPPPERVHKTMMSEVTPAMKEQLKALSHLASKRFELREAAGGISVNMHRPDVEVYSSNKGPGLPWDHPYRKGSRITEGDPVIKLSTKGFLNWFSASDERGVALVREMMLLACETAAKWCEERKVPAIFRGTLLDPAQPDPDNFFRDVVKPAMTSNGEIPTHLGVQYLTTLGTTALSTKPSKHKTLGMDHYGKVTSPLRRYGDMILHWQIEGALREEARRRQSLVTNDDKADRSFLPFSAPVLDTIMLGLQPREKIITRASAYAEQFWIAQLLFRAFHYGEAKLPWIPTDEPFDAHTEFPNHVSLAARPPPPPQNYLCHAFIHSANSKLSGIGCMNVELNTAMFMDRPEIQGLGVAQQGDVWECAVIYVDCYRRTTFVKPRRLVYRPEV